MLGPTDDPTINMLYAELNKLREENTELRRQLLLARNPELAGPEPVGPPGVECPRCGRYTNDPVHHALWCKEKSETP